MVHSMNFIVFVWMFLFVCFLFVCLCVFSVCAYFCVLCFLRICLFLCSACLCVLALIGRRWCWLMSLAQCVAVCSYPVFLPSKVCCSVFLTMLQCCSVPLTWQTLPPASRHTPDHRIGIMIRIKDDAGSKIRRLSRSGFLKLLCITIQLVPPHTK